MNKLKDSTKTSKGKRISRTLGQKNDGRLLLESKEGEVIPKSLEKMMQQTFFVIIIYVIQSSTFDPLPL